jgi:hypothetical protein
MSHNGFNTYRKKDLGAINIGRYLCGACTSSSSAEARAAGVEVRLDVFPEMYHLFQLAAGNMPEADDAVERIGMWLQRRLQI